MICSSPLSDHDQVTASNQFAHNNGQWQSLKDREAHKKGFENGGKHPSGSTAILCMPREKGGRGLRSIEEEYKGTKTNAALTPYRNGDPAMPMVLEFEERLGRVRS